MVQNQYRESLHTLPIIYRGDRGFVDIMCFGRQPPASNQGGGPTKRENAKASQWTVDMQMW